MVNLRSRRLRWAALAAVFAAIAGAGGALAAYPQDSVAVYTGCLQTSGTGSGQIASVAISATTPLKPCNPNQALIHFSGGTITQVTAGTGLTGGGSSGYVTLSLDSKYTLPQGCSAGNIVKWNGSAWVCGTDQTYTNGTGLDLSGNTFSVKSAYQLPQSSCSSGQVVSSNGSGGWSCTSQNSYSGSNFALSNQSCGSGNFMTGIDSTGKPNCGADNSYNGTNFALSNQNCSSGQVMTGVDSTGHPSCAAGASLNAYNNTGGVIVNSGNFVADVASLDLPAGSYIVWGWAHITDADLDSQHAICDLESGGTKFAEVDTEIPGFDGTNVLSEVVPLNGVVTLGSDATVDFKCGTYNGDIYGGMSALRVSAINP